VCLGQTELSCHFLLRPVEEEAQEDDPTLPWIERTSGASDQRPLEHEVLDERLVTRPLVLCERERRLSRPLERRVHGTRGSRDTDGGSAVSQVMPQLAVDGAVHVRGQELAAAGIAPIHRADDCERSHLHEVIALDTTASKSLRCNVRKREVQLDQAAPFRVETIVHDCHASMLRRRRHKEKSFTKHFSYVTP
jgi:hypothetical protein